MTSSVRSGLVLLVCGALGSPQAQVQGADAPRTLTVCAVPAALVPWPVVCVSQ